MMRSAEDSAHKVVWQILLGLSGCLIGLVSFGFLATWAFLTLSAAAGPPVAALFLGAAFLLFAGVLLGLACKGRFVSKDVGATAATNSGESDVATIVAFTAAFVLIRYLTSDKSD